MMGREKSLSITSAMVSEVCAHGYAAKRNGKVFLKQLQDDWYGIIYLEGGRFGVSAKLGVGHKGIAKISRDLLRQAFRDQRLEVRLEGPPIYLADAVAWAKYVGVEAPTSGVYTGKELDAETRLLFVKELLRVADAFWVAVGTGVELIDYVFAEGRHCGIVQSYLFAVLLAWQGPSRFQGYLDLLTDEEMPSEFDHFKLLLIEHASLIRAELGEKYK